ncbi:MAG: C50 carotenoid epsilon cyclase, partial [Methanosarcinaceae archaeon]|nr:C50 carotenoid epsilon cyclase [Methanosarcinaceae archaeon]
GIVLSHPDHKEWIGTKTLADFEDPAIVSMAKDIKNGTSGNIRTQDPTTFKEVIMFYEPVRTGNYSFIMVVPIDEMLAGVTSLRNQLIVISAIALFLMGVLGYLVALSITRPINNIVADFKYISDGALHGKLDSRADTEVEADFKKIPVGLNEILDVLKKNSDELRTANDELKSLDKMKDEFLSNVSHELKTPLTLISGYTELLSEGTMGELNEGQIKVQEKVVRNAERLKRLVDSLLYLNNIQAGTVEYVFEPLQIREIIDVILDDLKIMTDQKGIDLEMNVEEDLPMINGDKERIMDMITNIVDNATKFTPSGGKIFVRGFTKDSDIYVVVKDTGIGIPKEMIDNLFQRFYQIDASRTRKYGGTGLGLYISRTIAEAHNGDIWATSEGTGKGTEMHIRIPISDSNINS